MQAAYPKGAGRVHWSDGRQTYPVGNGDNCSEALIGCANRRVRGRPSDAFLTAVRPQCISHFKLNEATYEEAIVLRVCGSAVAGRGIPLLCCRCRFGVERHLEGEPGEEHAER